MALMNIPPIWRKLHFFWIIDFGKIFQICFCFYFFFKNVFPVLCFFLLNRVFFIFFYFFIFYIFFCFDFFLLLRVFSPQLFYKNHKWSFIIYFFNVIIFFFFYVLLQFYSLTHFSFEFFLIYIHLLLWYFSHFFFLFSGFITVIFFKVILAMTSIFVHQTFLIYFNLLLQFFFFCNLSFYYTYMKIYYD
jgi:hypothetical protein